MTAPASTPKRPSLITLAAATIAGPLHVTVTVVIALVLIALGVLKFLPADIAPATVGTAEHSPAVDLFTLATGGVITTPWGQWLVGAVQALLGLGLLIRPARPLAGLGCLAMTVVVVIGFVVHLGTLTDRNGLNQAGVALLMLIVILLAGAVAGTRAAARGIGVPT
jgi:hypothetical protein